MPEVKLTRHTISKPTILLMLSGGLDSLGCLHILLTDPKYQDYAIHAHHVHIVNYEDRADAEQLAIQRILEYAKTHYRKFEYSESSHMASSFNSGIPWDSDVTNFVAGNICLSCAAIVMVAIGRTKTDEVGGDNYSKRVTRSVELFKLFSNATKLYPVMHLNKQDVYALLPPELSSLAWSCRTPIKVGSKFEECGKCKTCTLELPLIRRQRNVG